MHGISFVHVVVIPCNARDVPWKKGGKTVFEACSAMPRVSRAVDRGLQIEIYTII
jgi:hypothetical protein